jgi:hypothetical protein
VLTEPDGIQVDDVTAEPPSTPAPRGDVEMMTEDEKEKARLFLPDLR